MTENRPRLRRRSAALVMFCAVAASRPAGAGGATDALAAPSASAPAADGQAADRTLARPSKATRVRATRPAAGDSTTRDSDDSTAAAPARGMASFYAQELSGRRTASGERYDPTDLTAAHRSLPMGTQLRVVNAQNDRSVVVTVNDRGPVPKNRLIDVSAAAAHELGMKRSGVTRVDAHVVGRPTAAGDEARSSTARDERGGERNGSVASGGPAAGGTPDDRH